MPLFKATVRETRTYDVEYTVEADTFDEAIGLLETGETVSEKTLRMDGVTDRTRMDDPEEIKG